ncbi:MAG: LL-diaminopimelate aminotransferase [Bacteroidota bacterium]
MIFADRIGGRNFGRETKLYKFAVIKQAKAEARALHPDLPLIDLGVGEPDRPADAAIVEILAREAGKQENRLYADNGIPEFQEAAARYLERVYGVVGIDPYRQILHGIGSKPILALLPLCLINPGDITLTTIPGYPVIATYTEYAGGEVYPLPLKRENNFFPELSKVPPEILKRAKLLYINYPNNPTGQTATEGFYEEVVEFARKNRIIVVVDAAYAALTYDGYKPLSFLKVPGAVEVGVEIHSLSKAFNMTGWRLAFLAGNPELIKAYGTIKDNTDSGQFRAIQKAGIYALDHPELTQVNCERYSRRFEMLIPVLQEVGFDAAKPKASFYCYVRAPKGSSRVLSFKNAEEAASFLVKEALISTVPWDDAGPYLRLAVTFEAQSVSEEEKIIMEIKQRLLELGLYFE